MAPVRPAYRPLSQQTLVVVGATSGIGHATARFAAARGASVFLIGSGEAGLRALSEALQAEGGRAAYAVAEPTDPVALSEAAARCVRLYGGFDTWVQVMPVLSPTELDDRSAAGQRQAFDTAYWSVVNGALVGLEHLRDRPDGGTLILVGAGEVRPRGVQGSVRAALRGFIAGLRAELAADRLPVALTLVKPAQVDTPGQGSQAPRTPAPGPIYSTGVVADVVLHCAQHPVSEITVGGGGRLVAALRALAPRLADPILSRLYRSYPPRGPARDDLWDPTEDAPYGEEARDPLIRGVSLTAQARMHPRVTAGGVLALFLVGAAVIAAQRLARTSAERARRRRADQLADYARLAARRLGAGLTQLNSRLRL